jgi:hypothetical protein
MDSANLTLVTLNPWWTKTTSEYRLLLGLDMTLEANEDPVLHIYPQALMQFKIVENILIPYIGLNGMLETNNYGKIIGENPFIAPGLRIRNSDKKLEFFGGIKGNFSTRSSFKIKATYALVDDMYFFVNDSTSDLENKFIAAYDDVEMTNYYGELKFNPDDKLGFLLKGNYYKYILANLENRAWHKPQFDITLSARYNLRNKILVSADILGYGSRYAKSNDPFVREVKMNGFVDVNLGLEYRYTKILSGFVKFNNIAASRYSWWNQYPNQRFFIMFGFTYAM